jgi:hypothetical protein
MLTYLALGVMILKPLFGNHLAHSSVNSAILPKKEPLAQLPKGVSTILKGARVSLFNLRSNIPEVDQTSYSNQFGV